MLGNRQWASATWLHWASTGPVSTVYLGSDPALLFVLLPFEISTKSLIKSWELVSKASSQFNGLVLVSISNVGFQLFSRMVLSEVKDKKWSEVEVKRWWLSKKFLCLFTAALRSCAFLNTFTMGTAFPRVPPRNDPWSTAHIVRS